MSVLVLAEHDNKHLKDATLSAVTAATQLGGDVHVLVAGNGADAVAAEAAKVAGVSKVLLANDAAYGDALWVDYVYERCYAAAKRVGIFCEYGFCRGVTRAGAVYNKLCVYVCRIAVA